MRGLLAVATLGLLIGACSSPSAVKQPPQPHQATALGGFSTAPGGKPGDWTSQAKDFANSRYSTLNQINTGNVGRLRVAWTFSDGALYGHEGAPLVVDNTMYTVSPFPDRAFALDLTKPGGPIKWTYDPAPSPMAIGKACCDPVLRGWAIADGKLIYNLLDAHVVAVDLKTGKEMWRTKMADVSRGVTMTMSAFVAGDKVYVGNSGGEMGVSGWFAALDVHTGKELWRAYSTGSDKDVKIGARFKPLYPQYQGKDLGLKSWPTGASPKGAGAVWGFISYDPKLNLVYYGTSNPSPRVPSQRPGDNLWTSSVFARDATTGEAVWAYQFTPHDQWDYDGVNEMMLLDLPINGKMRHTIVHFDRNTYAYVLDRETGEVLKADTFAHETWSSGFDWKTKRPIVNQVATPKVEQQVTNICPPDIGQKDWEPPSYSPRTGLIYVGIFNLCMNLTDHKVSYIPGTPYDGMEMTRQSADGDKGNWGALIAWDPVAGKRAWAIPEKFMVMSGTIATAGDVVFYGTTDGWFRAIDARSGKILWQQKLSSGVIGQPMTYLGPDGHQYVAVASGVGGGAMVQSGKPGFPARGSTLYVFSIDGQDVSGPATPAWQDKD
ncbi:PQQ-dependent dehydrogenase, methanol/ethanol family [Sphingomonas sp. 10B4]|uniref:PQQ-dependent dehydrogenase, methanol/ethanol family n=1 Tax=Sphingomonas sp. 10B4 TaxID=3048575 RepID=UPI002AB3D1B7|nr:PQQ-dependent dehydrogenase, methanol/ethanol family [Sphingomonas sp. 10B4]MDY7524619.1 PQQ-dependent dehydrogenase, methanol/ethanol family [Sphingomonas sp. 10B4]MEB0282424.1 PQQ-dependent dehydrogenase, methanol/ethanol family [Sphingomonas sp. 10B4]